MATDLARYEEPLAKLAPRMAQVLPVSLDPQVINGTIMHALNQNSYLAQAEPNSVLGAAMTAACLGLTCDGFGGQGYLVPFAGRGGPKAQFLCGYKGHVTLADRALRAVSAGVILEGDGFEFDEPAGEVVHQRKLGNEKERQVLAAWCRITSRHVPAVVRVLSYDEIIERRDRSAGYKAFKSGKARSSVWDTDFRPMARKSAIIEASSLIPVIPLQLAAQLHVQSDLGHHAQLNDHGNMVIDGQLADPPPAQPSTRAGNHAPPQPAADPRQSVYLVYVPNRSGDWEPRDCKTVENWLSYMEKAWTQAVDKGATQKLAERNLGVVEDLIARHPGLKVLSVHWLDRLIAARDG